MSAEFDDILAKLTAGAHLTREQSRQALLYITSGSASETEICDFLVKLPYQRVTVDELAGAAAVMREKVIPIPTGDGEVLDTCGTGGDVRHTFNISTAAAIITASCGVKIVKHGNRSASGRAGSADVLEKLGMRLELPPPRLAECLQKLNICFAYAPALHPAMKCVSSARKSLGTPTIFNLLGPLTNPGQARLHLLGVFSADLTERVAAVLGELGSQRAWVVHAEDGLDEMSTLSPTRVSELKHGHVRTWTFHPSAHGFSKARLSDLQINDTDEAAMALVAVLEARGGPKHDIACLNAAAALVVAGKAAAMDIALPIVQEAIDSGKARATLEELIRFSRE